ELETRASLRLLGIDPLGDVLVDQAIAVIPELVTNAGGGGSLPPHGSTRRLEDCGHRRGQSAPRGALILELLPAESRQRVEARFAAGLRRRPLRAHPFPLLQAVQGRIERALLHLKDIARDL